MKSAYPSQQHGFAAVAAIFLVVVLAALGSYMVSFSNAQQITSAQDALGTRAYWAARAGIEWGVSAGAAASACPAASTSLSLQGFSVVVTCAATAYAEGSTTVNILRFTSEARMGAAGTTGYIERSVSASLEQ